VIVWLGIFVAGLTTILGAYLYLHPPDYGLVAENRAVLDTLPVYPRASFVRETSAHYRDRAVGFATTRTFRLPPRSGVVAFYVRTLRGRCVLVSAPASFRCGRAAVVVTVHGARYDLTADSR
jgi:hypothetical protein